MHQRHVSEDWSSRRRPRWISSDSHIDVSRLNARADIPEISNNRRVPIANRFNHHTYNERVNRDQAVYNLNGRGKISEVCQTIHMAMYSTLLTKVIAT
jgi:hypothetical protein